MRSKWEGMGKETNKKINEKGWERKYIRIRGMGKKIN